MEEDEKASHDYQPSVEAENSTKLLETEEATNTHKLEPVSGMDDSRPVQSSPAEHVDVVKEENEEASPVYGHSVEVERSTTEILAETEEVPNSLQSEPISEMDDLQLVGLSSAVTEEAVVVGVEDGEASRVPQSSLEVERSITEKLTENEEIINNQQCEHISEGKLPETEEIINNQQCEHISEEKFPDTEEIIINQQCEHDSEEKLQETEEIINNQQCKHISEEKLPGTEEIPNSRQCENVSEIDGSNLAAPPSTVTEEPNLVGEGNIPRADMEMEAETETADAIRNDGKRKRGRQQKVQSKATSKKKEEEDVCFICFDGGNLVLCDRRGCPKAYHPSCVNRDEAFFRSKGRWNCGWHICTICEKSAYYMCYTCTYSLCKGCIKEANILCVRGSKGFCETCMRTVMLIEKNEAGDQAQVNFDDKNSWEFLFKDYWIDLKEKLSITLDELVQARNPWKASGVLDRKEESSDELYDAVDDKGSNSDSSSGPPEASIPKRKKTKRHLKSLPNEDDSPSVSGVVANEVTPMLAGTEWASKELLEFVAHMKNGDISVLSQFDVQALLLEYIKRNNLRDPRRKSQIICDSRLEKLFGKARVGHFEMLKLLESHFLIKEDSHADDIHGGVLDNDVGQLETDGNNDNLTKTGKDRRRKTRKKGEERGPQTNLDDYAAIDVNNINLIYLRRNLMEDLLEDADNFRDKVVGSFVKIRISGAQKQDMYRLVQVVGTSKVDEPYKTGKRTTDILLEIQNLNKTEVISIDTISNQEFYEDECKRLRQSIKCGLISRLTVGDIQEKAMALQAVRVNDWLESEKLRVSHLRDRASEKGRRKELRECVEKLQLLNNPEERQRRLQEIPEVNADPKMNPSYESEEDEDETDDKNQVNYMRPRDAGFGRKGREMVSPGKGSSTLNDVWSGTRKNSATKDSSDKGEGATRTGERMSESSWNQGRDVHQLNSGDKSKNQVSMASSNSGVWNSQVLRSGSSAGAAVSEASSEPPSIGVGPSAGMSDTDKMWHYQDPSGKIQGPFSMVQLRKWSTTGYFPADLRIWKVTEKKDNSILLTDALIGKFYKEATAQEPNSVLQPQKIMVASAGRENNWNGGWRGNNSLTLADNRQSGPSNGNTEYSKADGRNSSGWAPSATQAINPRGVQTGSFSRSWSGSGQMQMHSPTTPTPSPTFSGKPYSASSHQTREGRGERWNSGQHRGTWSSPRSTGFHSGGHGYDKRSSNHGPSGQSPWRSQPENSSSRAWSNPPSVKTPKFSGEGWGGADQGSITASANLPTPTPHNITTWTAEQVAGSVPIQHGNPGWGTTPMPGDGRLQQSHAPVSVPEHNKTATDWGEDQRISVAPPSL